jgi:hypothetical protein
MARTLQNRHQTTHSQLLTTKTKDEGVQQAYDVEQGIEGSFRLLAIAMS